MPSQRIRRITQTLDLFDEMRTALLHRERVAGYESARPAPPPGTIPVEAPASGGPAPVDGPSSEVGEAPQPAVGLVGQPRNCARPAAEPSRAYGFRDPWQDIPYPNGQSVYMHPIPRPLMPIHHERAQRGIQPWVREEDVRRQWDDGPQHPVSMLERAGTARLDGRPSMFQVGGNGEVRIRTQFWQSVTLRQRRRWNERGRFQFSGPETGRPPASIEEALANHQTFIDRRADFCRAQAERMQRRMNESNLCSGRPVVTTYNVPR